MPDIRSEAARKARKVALKKARRAHASYWLRRSPEAYKRAEAYCKEGRAMGFTCDHIFAVTRNGPHHIGNLCWLTRAENVSKKNHLAPSRRGNITCIPYVPPKYRDEIDYDGHTYEQMLKLWATETPDD